MGNVYSAFRICATVARSPRYGRESPISSSPFAFVFTLQTKLLDVINSVEPSSPKAQLAVGLPIMILPSNFPSGVIIKTPPGPVAQRLPF